MTGEEAKTLYKMAQTGSASPYGDIYAMRDVPPSSPTAAMAESLWPMGVYFGRNRIPGIGAITRAPEELARRHYINMAQRAGLFTKGYKMPSLLQNLSRKGSIAQRKVFENWAKTVAERTPEKSVFKTWSRMRPQRLIKGKDLPRLSKALRGRALGAAIVMMDPLIETIKHTLKRPRIAKANRMRGFQIQKANPFLRKA